MSMRACLLGLALALGACASRPDAAPPARLFADAAFGERPALPDAGSVFALSPAMRDYLEHAIRPRIAERGPRLALYEALSGALRLDYDTAITRTAAEAFEARAGNCLSLVILTGALAAELDLPVSYQSVSGQDIWSRSGSLAFLSGHVNLALEPPALRHAGVVLLDAPLVIDFVTTPANRARSRTLARQTVLAMYYNNRAAETLLDGDSRGAYWWSRAAIETAPDFLPAYNTLGVVYARSGLLREAERALDHALAREPGNAQALSNLVSVLTRQNRDDEARRAARRLARLNAHPPFHFLDLGLAALEEGRLDAALRHFERELERIPYDHELQFALARAHWLRGDAGRAQRHLERALENGPTRADRAIYAAKLDALQRRSPRAPGNHPNG